MDHITTTDDECIIDENGILDHVLVDGIEVRYSTYSPLSCDTYSTLDEYKPKNMVFLDYKKSDDLQKLLSKYHCPHLLSDGPIHANTAENKGRIKVAKNKFVKIEDGTLVPLDEWMKHKMHVLPYALDLNKKHSCVGKTNELENKLMTCKDNALHYF